jgi:hypothetical protein
MDAFINEFRDIFILKALGENQNDEFINCANTDYVMRRIRKKILKRVPHQSCLSGHARPVEHMSIGR